jgi:integrase
MRHTFASHYLPLFGADATIRQLGHGDHTMLFNHYRALVHDDLAKLYWQLTPDVVKDEKKLAELIAKAAPLEKRITQSS